MTGWEKDEARDAQHHAERTDPVQYWAERDRAQDEARAEAHEQKREN